MLTTDEVLAKTPLTAKEIAACKSREMVRGTRDAADDRDLAAWFCFLIKADSETLRNGFMTSDRATDKSVAQIGHVDVEGGCDGDDPFASLKLEPNGAAMAKVYLSAKPGSSGDLNLSEEEMSKFTALPKGASQADVEATLRTVLSGRLEAYKQRGLEGIAPYCRGKGKNHEPGKELALKSSMLPLLEKLSPEFNKYLLEFPNSKPEGIKESFSWVNFTVDDKPDICLVHKMGLEAKDGLFVFCQRHFYVSRGHNNVQGVGGCFPVDDGAGPENLVLYISRTSTDQVSGFGGSAKRTIGSKIMSGKIALNFEAARDAAEKASKK